MVSPFVLSFFGLYVAACMIHATKAAYHERRNEGFDVTVPTAFETGVLVLRSRGDKCAAFFALALPLKDLDTERIRRTLTTLLKVLPHSSVLSTEITTRNDCYATFYIKLEKSDVLQRTRELAESVLSGFKALLGEHNVRLLHDEELLRHLALGLPGRIRWVGRSDRHTALLRTDKAKCWLSVIALTQMKADLVQAIAREASRNGEAYRVVFAVKNEEQRSAVTGPKLILITANGRPHSDPPILASHPTVAWRMRASEIIPKLGDLMARNVLENGMRHTSFDKGADELLSFLALWTTNRSESESASTENGIPQQTITKAPEWREVLTAHAEELGLLLERDVLVSTNGFPLRVDARIGLTLFKIVPDCSGDRARLRWLADQMVAAMASESDSRLVLLLANPSDASTLTEVSTNMPAPERVRTLTAAAQLQAVVLECRTQAERTAEPSAEPVQKIL
jgi:hypothetical protein